MKTIYVVHYDWAYSGGSSEGILGCYENLGDAMACMSLYWSDEREMEYFEDFDKYDMGDRYMKAWENQFYCDSHSEVYVIEYDLFSHEDVERGLDR